MKKIFSILALAAGLVACTSNPTAAEQEEDRVLVAYFSATGTTEGVAKMLAAATGGDLLEIAPATLYTEADLDWRDQNSRSSIEMKDSTSRPELADSVYNVKDYDIIYLGYPIWWDLAPRVINTFLESVDIQDKTIIPFATSGSSTIDNSAKVLAKEYPAAKWMPGKLLNNVQEADVQAWVSGEEENTEE